MRSAKHSRGIRARVLALIICGALALSAVGLSDQPGRVRAQDDGEDLSGQTATIARSEDGVNLRSEPGFGGDIVATLSDGTVVELRIDSTDTVLDEDGETRWWPVSFDGEDGWVAGYYLDLGWETTEADAQATEESDIEAADSEDTGESEDSGDSDTTGNTDVFLSGPSARITSSDGANFRVDPSTDSDVIDVLPLDTVVDLRIDEADTVVRGGVRWWPVSYNGDNGWVAGDFLGETDGSAATDDAGEPASTDAAAAFAAGDYVQVGIDNGVNIRSGAGVENEQIATIRAGDVVQVMDGPFPAEGTDRGWFLVTDGDITGYVDGDLITIAEQPAAPSDDADPVDTSTDLAPARFVEGDFAKAHRDGTNVRSAASRSAGILVTLDPGEIVDVLSGAVYDDRGDAWYLVTDGNITGYANGSFLHATDGSSSSSAEPAEEEAPAQPIAGQATGTFIPPVASWTFTQAYGCSVFVFEPWDPALGCNFHNGVDLANPAGTSLMASDGGVVKFAGWCDCGLGWYVEIDHGNGFSTIYGHMLQMPAVTTGQAVAQGEYIGQVGSSGASTGPHTHFMIKLNGSTVDPLGYIPQLAN